MKRQKMIKPDIEPSTLIKQLWEGYPVLDIHGSSLALEKATVVISEATDVAHCLTPNFLKGIQGKLGLGLTY